MLEHRSTSLADIKKNYVFKKYLSHILIYTYFQRLILLGLEKKKVYN